MRDFIWWELPFSSSHMKYELVHCCFNPSDLWCRRMGQGLALLSLHFFCMLCSHPLRLSFLSIAMQPEGVRREKTQNSLICTKGKGLTYCYPERNWKEGWSLHPFLQCWLMLSLPFSSEVPKRQLAWVLTAQFLVRSGTCHFGSVCAAVQSAPNAEGQLLWSYQTEMAFLCKIYSAFHALVFDCCPLFQR